MKNIELFKVIITNGILDIDSKYWINQFYHHKSHNPSVVKSNRGGYQSKNDINLLREFFPLVQIVNNLIFSCVENPNLKLTELWFNINSPGSFNRMHDHGGFVSQNSPELSGVIYLQVPKNSGNIVFYSPIGTNHNHEFSPLLNEFFLFPQWLRHSVDPNLSKEDRISIAFNYHLF